MLLYPRYTRNIALILPKQNFAKCTNLSYVLLKRLLGKKNFQLFFETIKINYPIFQINEFQQRTVFPEIDCWLAAAQNSTNGRRPAIHGYQSLRD